MEALISGRQTSLHTAATEEHRDTAFDSGAETLSFLKRRTAFQSLTCRGFDSAPLRNADALDACLTTKILIVRAIKAAIGGKHIGNRTEGLLVRLQARFDMVFIGGISIQHAIL